MLQAEHNGRVGKMGPTGDSISAPAQNGNARLDVLVRRCGRPDFRPPKNLARTPAYMTVFNDADATVLVGAVG